MKQKWIEHRRVMKASCRREVKFAFSPDDSEEVRQIKAVKQQCEFGLTEIAPACGNCVWFECDKINDGFNRPLMSDREIEKSEIEGLKSIYAEIESHNSTKRIPLKDGQEIFKIVEGKQNVI